MANDDLNVVAALLTQTRVAGKSVESTPELVREFFEVREELERALAEREASKGKTVNWTKMAE